MCDFTSETTRCWDTRWCHESWLRLMLHVSLTTEKLHKLLLTIPLLPSEAWPPTFALRFQIAVDGRGRGLHFRSAGRIDGVPPERRCERSDGSRGGVTEAHVGRWGDLPAEGGVFVCHREGGHRDVVAILGGGLGGGSWRHPGTPEAFSILHLWKRPRPVGVPSPGLTWGQQGAPWWQRSWARSSHPRRRLQSKHFQEAPCLCWTGLELSWMISYMYTCHMYHMDVFIYTYSYRVQSLCRLQKRDLLTK